MSYILHGPQAQATADEAYALFASAQEWQAPDKSKKLVAIAIPKDAGAHDIEIAPRDGERIAILVGEGASVRIAERGHGAFEVDIALRENASVTYCSSGEGTQVRRHALLSDDARIRWLDASQGGARSDVTSYLAGKGADARYASVFLGVAKERYDVRSRMIHLGDKGTSDMRTRAVMLGASVGRYEGLIRIDEKARGCDAYQKEDTLLLSEDARMDATPNLEIRNEEVKCSHGVSLGQVDEEKLFYFLARGIPRDMAVRLIVEGFFAEILDSMGAQGAQARSRMLSRLEGAA